MDKRYVYLEIDRLVMMCLVLYEYVPCIETNSDMTDV